MKKFCFLIAIAGFLSFKSNAQSTSPANLVTNPGVSGGYFNIVEGIHTHNVNYAVYMMDGKMQIQLGTPYTEPVSIKVLNNAGTVVKTFASAVVNGTRQENYTAAPGSYTVVVSDQEGNMLKEIAYTVE